MALLRKEITWACTNCTFDNKRSNGVCQMCSSEPPHESKLKKKKKMDAIIINQEIGWSCDSCTFENKSSDGTCQMCMSKPASEAFWKCKLPECSYFNPPTNESCEGCKLRITKNETDEKDVKDQWKCAGCTYLNPLAAEKCAVCLMVHKPRGITSWTCLVCNSVLPDVTEVKCVVCTALNPLWDENKEDEVSTSEKLASEEAELFARFGAEDAASWTQVESAAKMFEDQKRKARQTWENILSECTILKTPFLDPDFAPCQRSVGERKDGAPHGRMVWNRCDSIKGSSGKAWTVVRNGFRAGDILQGQLGDCWFLSALAVLAENPTLINNVMLTQEFNPVGAYQVRFCKNGKWQVVIVDDFFPCNDYGGLAFSKAKHNQLWIPLIEKAYAKLHGSYYALESGETLHAMADLTGAPCEKIDMSAKKFDSDLTWARLMSFQDRHFLMAASCGNQPLEQYGLQSNHCYSLLDVREVDGNKLLKLRNPWGKADWVGNFSRFSELWTPQLRCQLRVEHKDDGVFWIDWGSFLTFYSTIDVCKYADGWNQIGFADKFSPQTPVSDYAYVIRVPRNTWAFISITQKDKRGQSSDYRYIDTGCIVTKTKARDVMDHRHHNYVGSCFPGVRRTKDCEVIFSDSECSYVVQPFSMLPKDNSVEVMLTFYSANRLWIQKVRSKPTCLTKGCQLALTHREKGEKYSQQLDEAVSLHLRYRGDGIWVMIENRHPEKHFLFSSEWTARGLSCSRLGIPQTADFVAPLSRQIVIALSVENPYKGYSWQRRHSHKFKRPGSQEVHHSPPLTSEHDIHSVLPF